MRLAVIGAGSWGTALAIHLARLGHGVTLWVHGAETYEALRRHRENTLYLPGITLPPSVDVTPEPMEALQNVEGIVVCVPSSWFRATLRAFRPAWEARSGRVWVVSATKGIEPETYATMTEVLQQEWPGLGDDRLAVLSGPSFAREVAEERPTAIVIASPVEALAERLQAVFHGRNLRVYRNTDRRGVELAGAMKNVMALAAGMAAGLQFGHNAVAALITRGLAEMIRLGTAMGARRDTFYGLAGVGDLVLTCTGPLSRNRMVGYRLGLGEPLRQVLHGFRMAVEGIPTVRALKHWADAHGVDAPITQAVYGVLYEGEPISRAVRRLLERPLKSETEGAE
jgi:glycerol-3-phosphate dehydrogenase (NAD(P)+)